MRIISEVQLLHSGVAASRNPYPSVSCRFESIYILQGETWQHDVCTVSKTLRTATFC
jgi:hypothetical protein